MKGPGKKVVTDVKLMDPVATKERHDSVSEREKSEREKLYGGYGYVLRCFERGLKNFHVVFRSLADTWTVYDNSGKVPRLLGESP